MDWSEGLGLDWSGWLGLDWSGWLGLDRTVVVERIRTLPASELQVDTSSSPLSPGTQENVLMTTS